MTSSTPRPAPKFIKGDYALRLAWLYDQADIVGLPSPQDLRDMSKGQPVRLEQLYVPLSFSPERARAPKDRFYLPRALAENRHLVILGDPGSGKSTLVKVIVDQFGRSQATELSQRFGKLSPIPIILRDYKVRDWHSYQDMLESYVKDLRARVPELSYLESEWLVEQLQAGEAIVLLDGLDEVGSRADRQHLRDKVVFPLLRAFPAAYFMLTSRIVGYEEVSFERPAHGSALLLEDGESFLLEDGGELLLEERGKRRKPKRRDTLPDSREETSRAVWRSASLSAPNLERLYLAPFNDEDIGQFIQRWYATRENDPVKRREAVDSLASAIRQSDRVKQLAGTPALLTLMALVHRVFTYLPNGRVELYDKVAEAYLHTLDQAKFGRQYPATMQDMKGRLGRVGYELQKRREETYEESDTERNMLATEAEVLGWLTEAIAEKHDADQTSAREEAENFLAHVANRSGLLIPRGPNQYAFAHLTFQEYFAAQHMARSRKTLAQECGQRITLRYWHETLCVLFEILGKAEDEAADDLFDDLRAASEKASFKAAKSRSLKTKEKADELRAATAELFAALAVDDQNGLSRRKRSEAASFALTELCANHNDQIVKALRELPTNEGGPFDKLANQWLDRQLADATAPLGSDFFIAGLNLTNEISNDWPRRLAAWVTSSGYRPLTEEQWLDLALIGAGDEIARAQLCPSLVTAIRLPCWFEDVGWYWGDAISLAELYREPLESLSDNLPSLRLLREFDAGQALSNSLVIRAAMNLFADDDEARARALARALALARARARARARERDRDLARALARARDLARALARSRSRSLALSLARDLARSLAASLIAPPPASEQESQQLATPNASEWLLFAPHHAAYAPTIATLTAQAASAKDDWTRLQALNALLALGKGTPERCAARHALVAKGNTQPEAFSFPADMAEATATAEFRAQLPDLMQLCFIYSPENEADKDWINPADFAPDSPHTQFFTSEPYEFFIAAAEVLDPNNETDLRKVLDKM